MKRLYQLFTIIFYLLIVFIVLKFTSDFYENKNRISGIIMCLYLFFLGILFLRDNLYEYKQAICENNNKKADSRLFRLSRALGLVIAGILGVLFLIANWKNLR